MAFLKEFANDFETEDEEFRRVWSREYIIM